MGFRRRLWRTCAAITRPKSAGSSRPIEKITIAALEAGRRLSRDLRSVAISARFCYVPKVP
jgi:hypothetical protein